MKRIIIFSSIIFFIVIPLSAADNTSDKKDSTGKVFIPIPGVSDKMNTEDIIQKLLMVKKIPINKLEMESQDYKIENDIIKDLSKYLRDLDTKSRNLYDFQSPFREMTGESSDASVMEATAGRKSKKQIYKLTVNQLAKPDSFMSSSIPKNKYLSPSEFTLTTGGETSKIKFQGGTPAQFIKIIQDQAGTNIDTKIINDTSDTSILVISGKNTGKKNKINFGGDLKTFYDIGSLTTGVEKSEEFPVDLMRGSDNSNITAGNTNNAVIKPGASGEIGLSDKNIKMTENSYFIYDTHINKLTSLLSNTEGANLPPIDISTMEPVKVSNVSVDGGSLIANFEEKKKPQVAVSNFTEIITLIFKDGTSNNINIDSDGKFTNSLSSNKDKTIDKVLLRNQNTDREIELQDTEFLTKIEEGGIKPKNPISEACDANVNMDGVEIQRDNNKIDDLIDGVSLNLKKESKDPVTLNIDHNYQKITDDIQAWVDSYNQTMSYLATLTKPNQDRTPLSERNQQNLKDGIYQTETSFILLKNRLRNVAIDYYKTSYGNELSVLEQIGVYTKKAGSFSSTSEEWASTKTGLLNIDGDRLKSVLKTKFDGVEQLFANDLIGDMTKNSGAAVAANQSLKIALGVGNFIERRISFNDNKIKENQTEIDKMNKSLSDYELQQRMKYGKMNEAISESDSKQKWLNNQFKSQQ